MQRNRCGGLRRGLGALWRAKRASSAAELAILLPVMMLMVAGIIEFGRLYQVYAATNRLATQYAISWANCSENGNAGASGFCASELAYYTNGNAIANIVPELNLGQLTLTMAEFQVTAGVAALQYSGGYATGTTAANAAQLADATTRAATAFNIYRTPVASQFIVIVEAKYAHNLAFFNTIMSPVLANYLTPSYVVVQLKS